MKYQYTVQTRVLEQELVAVLERRAEAGWRMVQIIVLSDNGTTTGEYNIVWERENA